MRVGLRSTSRSTWISWKIYCCSWLATWAAGTRLWRGCSWGHDGCRSPGPYPFLWTASRILCGFGSWSGLGCLCGRLSAWNPWIPLCAFCTGRTSWPWMLAFQGSSRLSSKRLGFGKGNLVLNRHLRRGSLEERLGPLSSLRWLLFRARAFAEVASHVAVVYNSADCLTDAHFHFRQVTRDLYSRGQGRVDISLDMMKAAYDPWVMEPCTIPLGAAVDSCMAGAAGKVPRIWCQDPRLAMCFSGHPSMASQWRQETRASSIEGLVAAMHKEKDRVVAIWEVGLHYTGAKTPVLKENQEPFLKEFLTAVRSDEDLKDLTLVLHVKDMSSNKQDANARCLSILKEVGYPVSHKIYRHSFLGTHKEADAWIEAFPNVVFGASPKALSAPEETRDFFRSPLPRGGSVQVAGRSAWYRQSHADLKDCKHQFHGFLWNWRFPS